MKFHLATIHVANLEKSLAFYHDLLGIDIVCQFQSKDAKIAMLGEEGMPNIELICQEGESIQSPGDSFSIGFSVENVEEIIKFLSPKGTYKIKGPISPNPHLVFYFVTDPDGYQIQLLENK